MLDWSRIKSYRWLRQAVILLLTVGMLWATAEGSQAKALTGVVSLFVNGEFYTANTYRASSKPSVGSPLLSAKAISVTNFSVNNDGPFPKFKIVFFWWRQQAIIFQSFILRSTSTGPERAAGYLVGIWKRGKFLLINGPRDNIHPAKHLNFVRWRLPAVFDSDYCNWFCEVADWGWRSKRDALFGRRLDTSRSDKDIGSKLGARSGELPYRNPHKYSRDNSQKNSRDSLNRVVIVPNPCAHCEENGRVFVYGLVIVLVIFAGGCWFGWWGSPR